MKKIIGVLIVITFLLFGSVRAKTGGYYNVNGENIDSEQNNIDATLSGILTEAYHELDVKWGTFEYKFKLISKDIDENNNIEKKYDFVPVFQDSNAIFISNYSNVVIEIVIDWNSKTFSNNDSTIVVTNSHYNGRVECIKATEDDKVQNNTLYYDNLCMKAFEGIPDSNSDYYILYPYYTLSSQQNASTFRLSGNYVNQKIVPAFYDKWLFNLEPINILPEDLTEDMTLGTITITLSDIE